MYNLSQSTITKTYTQHLFQTKWKLKPKLASLELTQTDLCHYSFTSNKARNLLNSGQDLINTFLRHGRYQYAPRSARAPPRHL